MVGLQVKNKGIGEKIMKIKDRKQKGNLFEYSVRDSLTQIYPNVLLTKQEGFQKQFDIWIPSAKIAIECKRHKNFTWNELEKYFLKLEKRIKANKDENDDGVYIPYLIFQGNHQPCLVMYSSQVKITDYLQNSRTPKIIHIMKFTDYFGIPFLKHKGKKVKE